MKNVFLFALSIWMICSSSAGFGQLNASFTTSQDTACGQMTNVTLTDNSTGNFSSRAWFLNNQPLNQSGNSITQSFANPGNYTIRLDISDGNATASHEQTLVVLALPEIDFTSPNPKNCTGTEVTLNGISTSTINDWNWNFGDGSTANEQNPTHTFNYHIANNGTFDITLTATDNNGCIAILEKENYIKASPGATINTSSSNNFGCEIPHQVDVNLLTTGWGDDDNTFRYVWDFGDNTSGLDFRDGSSARGSHTYSELGTYSIVISIFDSIGCQTNFTLSDYVSIDSVFTDINFDTLACAGQNYRLGSTTSLGQYTWKVNGQSQTGDSIDITFAPNQSYEIVHIVSAGSTCSASDTLNVSVKNPQLNFNIDSTSACSVPFTFNITPNATPSNETFSYEWLVWDNRIDLPTATSSDETPALTVNNELDYTVAGIITDNYGCVDTLIQVDTIKIDFPIANFSMNIDSGCLPLPITFNSTSSDINGITDWSWDFGDGNTSTGDSVTNTYTTSQGKFYPTLTITNALGCTGSKTDSIMAGFKNASVASVIQKSKSDTFCFGSSDTIEIQIDSATTSQYHIWYFIDSALKASNPASSGQLYERQPEFDFFPPKTASLGFYDMIHIQGNYGCWDTTRHDSMFYVHGTIANFDMDIYCDTAELRIFNTISVEADSFNWDFGDFNNAIGDTVRHTYVYTMPGNDYEVTHVTYNDATGCTDTMKRDVFIRNPKAIIASQNGAYCAPLNITFDDGNSEDHETFRWHFGNGDTTNFSASDIIGHFSTPGMYRLFLEVKDINQCVHDTIDSIVISGIIPHFASDTLTDCIPFSTTLYDTSISDSARAFWQWSARDAELDEDEDYFNIGSDSALLDTFTQAGYFDIKLEVATIDGCTAIIEKEDYLRVIESNAAFSILENDRLICDNDTITVTNLSTTNSEAPLTFEWDFSYDSISFNKEDSVVSPKPVFFGDQINFRDTTYLVSLIVTDSFGCKDTSVVDENSYVEVHNPKANFTTSDDTFFCAPGVVNFQNTTVTESISEYLWDLSYVSPQGATISFGENPTGNFSIPEDYNIRLTVTTTAGCEHTIIKSGHVRARGAYAEIAYTNDPTICRGDSIEFSLINKVNVDSTSWAPAGSQFNYGLETNYTHTYFDFGKYTPFAVITNNLIGLDDTLCYRVITVNEDYSDSVIVQNIEANFSLDTNNGCQPFTLNTSNLSVNDSTYQWTFGQEGQSTGENPTFIFNDSGTYSIEQVVYSNIGCADTAYDTIRVHPLPEVSVLEGDTICRNDTFLLQGIGRGDSLYWMANNTIVASGSTIAPISPATTSNYFFHLIDSNNCHNVSSDSVTVKVIQPFNSQNIMHILSFDSALIENGEIYDEGILKIVVAEELHIALSDDSELPTIITWDDTTYFTAVTDTTFKIAPKSRKVNSLYDMTFNASITDTMGCHTETETITFTVVDSARFAMPEAFTPNGDGKNDIIFAKGAGIKELASFAIYNRWGELIYETDDITEGWDGKLNGKVQNPDKYIYVIKGTFYSGEEQTLKGSFLLLQ